MAKKFGGNVKESKSNSKKTRQGQGKFSKFGLPGANGGKKKYRKKYRGQGKAR